MSEYPEEVLVAFMSEEIYKKYYSSDFIQARKAANFPPTQAFFQEPTTKQYQCPVNYLSIVDRFTAFRVQQKMFSLGGKPGLQIFVDKRKTPTSEVNWMGDERRYVYIGLKQDGERLSVADIWYQYVKNKESDVDKWLLSTMTQLNLA